MDDSRDNKARSLGGGRTPRRVVIGHHLILHGYGQWLANDPRGSGSDYLREEKFADLGPVHHGRKRVQPTRETLRRFYQRATPRLEFEPIWFDDAKRQAVGEVFGRVVTARRYTVWGCAVLWNHAHLCIRRHRDDALKMWETLADEVRDALRRFADVRDQHPVWSSRPYKVFLYTRRRSPRCRLHRSQSPQRIPPTATMVLRQALRWLATPEKAGWIEDVQHRLRLFAWDRFEWSCWRNTRNSVKVFAYGGQLVGNQRRGGGGLWCGDQRVVNPSRRVGMWFLESMMNSVVGRRQRDKGVQEVRDGAQTRREFMTACGCGAASLYLGGCAPGPSAEYGIRRPSSLGRADSDSRAWGDLARIALERVRNGGAGYADIRLIETRTQTVRARDQRISAVSDGYSRGYGIRVLYKGAWGFAAGTDWSPDGIARVANRAVEVAQASAILMKRPVTLAGEPVHQANVSTPFKIDPFEVSLSEKCDLLLGACEILHKRKEVARSYGSLWAQRDRKHFASTDGTAIDFDLLATGGGFGGTAVRNGDFQSRELSLPYLRCGYEQIVEADFIGQAQRVADQVVEKLNAAKPTPGLYDLVLDPAHLSLTIHESCGHPTELDRALGYEANYAGTSFLTPDKRGHFRYGSEHVTLMADNLQERGLASTGFDDDGVACQKWPIVENGVFVGYSTNREVAHAIDEDRSRGSCRADSWASVPIVRISNIGLEPGKETRDSLIAGVDRGILIEGHGSFSIDQKRYNFQFGGDCFWEIKNGKVGAMLKDVIYHGITPEFWASCDGVADRSHRLQYGFITCGKGQPGQSGWMTHAASHARFRKVKVIDPKA